MGPHDALVIEAQKWKEELWAYLEEFEPRETKKAKELMNDLLDTIDGFVDEPEYK
jgi:hypothetical protein